MTETETKDKENPLDPIFADASVPLIFAEATANLSHNKQIAKFYLGRFDPAINGVRESKFNPSAQIVMPLDAFINLFAFFEHTIQEFIEDGVIKEEQLDNLRKILRDEAAE